VSDSYNWRVFQGVLAVGWTSAIVKLFGLADQAVLSRTYGTSAEMDAFNAAWALPSLLAVIFGAAIETTLVPIYVRARHLGDPSAADRAFSSLVNLCLIVFGLLSALSIVAAPTLLHLSAPGFAADRFNLALGLVPLLYPLILVNVLASLITSALNSRESFGRPTLAQAAVPIAILIAVVGFGKSFGVAALAVGQLVGFVLVLLVLIYCARRAGVHYRLTLDLGSNELKVAAQQSVPVIIGSLLIHANLFVDQVVASTLPVGQLSSLNYALKLVNFPVVVVFGAFSRATLPHFSRLVATRDWLGLQNSVRLFVWLMLAITLVMTAGAVVLSRPVIAILFQGGRFGAKDTETVAAVFIGAAFGLAPMGLSFVIPRVFNALQQNYTLTLLTIFSVGSNAVLDLVLAPRFGAVGITVATSLVYTAAIAIQIFLLSRQLGGFNPLGVPVQLRVRWRRLSASARFT
jgi:putative peptidoglycan lipid II flippase